MSPQAFGIGICFQLIKGFYAAKSWQTSVRFLVGWKKHNCFHNIDSEMQPWCAKDPQYPCNQIPASGSTQGSRERWGQDGGMWSSKRARRLIPLLILFFSLCGWRKQTDSSGRRNCGWPPKWTGLYGNGTFKVWLLQLLWIVAVLKEAERREREKLLLKRLYHKQKSANGRWIALVNEPGNTVYFHFTKVWR